MPNVKTITVAQALYGCKAREIRFQNLETTKGTAFLSMLNLQKAVLGSRFAALGAQDFNGCSALTTLVLPYNGVVVLNTDALKNTPIVNGSGYVYVPSAQVENYKANSSWSVHANQIRAMEDYPDEVA